MLGLKYLITVTKREFAEQYVQFFKEHGVKNVLSKLCVGTASDTTLNYLGLEKTEKVIFETMISADQTGDIVKGLLYEMNLGAVGNGIAMFIPVDSVGGKSSLSYFTGDLNTEKKESVMDKESKSVLIIVIVNKGNTDVVMDAARSVGAGGGTVARAKGTGAEMAKFFGVSISEEKEMVYIVAKREKRDDIMRAVMEKAGSNTESHGVIFSLPVDGVVGLKDFEGIL